MEPDFRTLAASVDGYVMTSLERQYALWNAIQYLDQKAVEGAIVECGVWRGGSMMLAARTLLSGESTGRELWLYDTFEGMTEPGEWDVSANGRRMTDIWERSDRPSDELFSRASISEVRENIVGTGYPMEKVTFVQGPVEETIPGQTPDSIALLRLDTDWYESTRHELLHLWPLLAPGGVLLIDDYGAFLGARKAVDEFFADREDAPLLHRIDSSGRIAVKAGP